MDLENKSRKLHERVLDWLLPPQCAGCGKLGSAWCGACDNAAQSIREPLCEKCGLPITSGSYCAACQVHDYAFDVARAWAAYRGGLRKAILSLKRRHNKDLGGRLASHLEELYRSQGWKADLLVPVPLAPGRRKLRGYNQVDLLARPVASAIGLPYIESALVRRHETEPQFELNAAQRWENLHGAFRADPAPLRGMSILLVDDIMTTGATLDAAAEALKTAGARHVFAMTLTRALFEPHGSIW